MLLCTLLGEVVKRLEARCPGDAVNLAQRNASDQDIFTMAAAYGCLSLVWQAVSAYYVKWQRETPAPSAAGDTTTTVPCGPDGADDMACGRGRGFIALNVPVGSEDWSRLSEADRHCFLLCRGFEGSVSSCSSPDSSTEERKREETDSTPTSDEYCF